MKKETPLTPEINKKEKEQAACLDLLIRDSKQRVHDLLTLMAMATSDKELTYLNIQKRDEEKYLDNLQKNGK